MQDAKLQGLLVDYQNTVLKAQKEVEDGLATFLQFAGAGRLSAPERRRRESALDIALIEFNAGHPRLHHRC